MLKWPRTEFLKSPYFMLVVSLCSNNCRRLSTNVLNLTQREDAVDRFRAGKTWVLIATDVLARGMDFKCVNCVINYDFPDSAAAYIHRIGMFLISNCSWPL
jgi:ERCC4-related helicase